MGLKAIINDMLIDIGTVIEIPHISEDYSFTVTCINRESFDIVWNKGASAGMSDKLPFVIFGSNMVKIVEDPKGDCIDPNRAFLYKRMMSNG